jgi:cysteine-rich repeat protein
VVRWTLAGLLIALVSGAVPRAAQSTCNVIPRAVSEFRGALGVVDRPFATPGDFVELTVRREICDGASRGLADFDGSGAITPDDVVVTLIFEPPDGGARNAVVVAPSCAPVTPKLAACTAQIQGGTATCVAAPHPDLVVQQSAIDEKVRFRFPDTDDRVGAPGDDRTLAGPATIAVTPADTPLPCHLAASRCAGSTGLIACVDELYEIDGTCETSPEELGATFASFTALPQPNDYEALCSTPGTPCDGTASEVRFTTDAAGNALVPFDWRGVLVRLEDVPIPRLVRASTSLPAFAGSAAPVQVPDDTFLASFSPEGHRLPPLFTPLSDPTASDQATLFGSVDASFGVVRIARQTCSESGCSDPLFEFRDRYVAGAGPVVVAASQYTAAAESPVPLDGLAQTESLFAFVRSEALENVDLNGDGDATDPVLTLRDRVTGDVTPIGTNGADGRAATRIRQLPFQYAALAVEDDVVAWLEPEPLEGDCSVPLACDGNGDGDVFDTILRVYRARDGTLEDLLGTSIWVSDAEPVLDGRSLVISDGLVVWRESEWQRAVQRTELISVAPDAEQAMGSSGATDLTPDGRFVVFSSDATNLVPGEVRRTRGVYLRDRAFGSTELVSIDIDGNRDVYANDGVATSDGRLVAFTGISLRDRCVANDMAIPGCEPRTEHVTDGTHPRISRDGRYLAYLSPVPTPEEGPYEVDFDLFVHDTCTSNSIAISGCTRATSRMSNTPSEADAPDLAIGFAGTTPDFRFLAFSGFTGDWKAYLRDRLLPHATVVAPDDPSDTNAEPDVYVLGSCEGARSTARCTPIVDRVSVRSDGAQALHPFGVIRLSTISDTGRFVGFEALSDELTPADANSSVDVFVRDRLTGLTGIVSTNPAGTSGNGRSDSPLLTLDARAVVFSSYASDLAPPSDPWRFRDAFLRGSDPNDCTRDLTGDCDQSDQVLSVLDGRVRGGPVHLGAAKAAAVSGGSIAYVDGETSAVRYWRNRQAGPPLDLGLPADALDLSTDWLAALASESVVGASLNGDPDTEDSVVHVNPTATATAGSWTNLALASDEVQVVGSSVAFLVLESSQGGTDLNGDGDADDYVMHVYDAETAILENLGLAAEDFVLGEELLAFRVSEAAQGNTDLNGDGDSADAVLWIYDLSAGVPLNTEQAALACRLEACDPRIPYRVTGDTVTYLTAEGEQGGRDLNGDGDASDLVLQVFNAKQAMLASADGATTPLAGATAGVCSDTGAACGSDASCGAEATCFVPPGACILDRGGSCSAGLPCPSGQFCDGETSTCRERLDVACKSTVDCPGASFCEDTDQEIQRLVAPIAVAGGAAAAAPATGDLVFPGAGVCVEEAGREHGTCASDADCPTGHCAPELTTATAADSDGDGLVDPIDDCPNEPNPDQADLDADGIGDACDLRTCGNGVVEGRRGAPGDEQCDDGNTAPGDGCDKRCEAEWVGIAIPTSSLWIRDDVKPPINPALRKISFKSNTRKAAQANRVIPPAPGSPDDPTLAGGTLTVEHEGGHESVTASLPPSGWRPLGRHSKPKGFRYENETGGPIRRVAIKPDSISVHGGGASWSYSLDEPSQGAVRVILRLGDSLWCAQALCNQKDEPGRCWAKSVGPPTTCP